MALETGTLISDLVATNPTVTDGLKEGDDHLRFIKSTILTTFPNITGAVTATHTLINGFDARITAVEGDYVAAAGGTFTGAVTMDTTLGVTGVLTATAAAVFSAGLSAGSALITDVLDPVSAQDAATKAYADAADALLLTIANNLSDVANAVTAFDNVSPTTTKGDLIVSDGTNNVRLPVSGTDGLFLMADSGEASGFSYGSPEWTPVETVVASGDANITFADLSGLGYSEFKVVFRDVRPDTDDTEIYLRLGRGVSAVDAGANYNSVGNWYQIAVSTNNFITEGASGISLGGSTSTNQKIGNGTGEGLYGEVVVHPDNGVRAHVIGALNYHSGGTNTRSACNDLFAEHVSASGAVDDIQLIATSGNISGTAVLMGRA